MLLGVTGVLFVKRKMQRAKLMSYILREQRSSSKFLDYYAYWPKFYGFCNRKG